MPAWKVAPGSQEARGSQTQAQVTVEGLRPEFNPQVGLSSPAPPPHRPLRAPVLICTGLCSKLSGELPGVNWLLTFKKKKSVKLTGKPLSGFGQRISLLSCRISCFCTVCPRPLALEVAGTRASLPVTQPRRLLSLLRGPLHRVLHERCVLLAQVTFLGPAAMAAGCGHLFRHQAVETQEDPQPMSWTSLGTPTPSGIIDYYVCRGTAVLQAPPTDDLIQSQPPHGGLSSGPCYR